MKKFNNIRGLREFKGYSQRYVAYKLKKSQSAFSKIENGITQTSDKIIEQLSEVLEVPKEKLFTDEQLSISDIQKDDLNKDDLNSLKEILETETTLQLPVNDIVHVLFNQLIENKKLLCEVQSNQEELVQQLNMLITEESDKK